MKQQRDAQGRFLVGNAGGPGRPKRQTEAGYLSVLMETVDLEQWRLICEAARDAAISGDEKARAWLARYLVGDPGTTAPKVSELVIAELLQLDPALDEAARRLAKPALDQTRYPSLSADDQHEADLQAEARRAILKAEAGRGAPQDPCRAVG